MTPARAHILSAVLLALGASAAQAENAAPKAEILGDGAIVAFARPARVERIEVWDCTPLFGKGRVLVCSESLPGRRVAKHRLFFRPPGFSWVILVFERGRREPWKLESGPRFEHGLDCIRVALEVPYAGETDVTRRWGVVAARESLVAPGSAVAAAVELYAARANVAGVVRIDLPRGLEPAGPMPEWTVTRTDNGTRFVRSWAAAAAGEVTHWAVPLRVTAAEGATLGASLRFDGWWGGDGTVLLSDTAMVEAHSVARVRVASPAKMAEVVRARELLMPTDPEGRLDVRRPRDTVVLPSGTVLALRRLLGVSEQYFDYYAPFTHETIVFENRGAQPVPLAVSMRVAGPDDNAPVPGFRAPDYLVGPDGALTATAELAPGGKTAVTMPIFLRPDSLLPGRYRTIVEARILGTDTLVARVEHPIDVRAPDVRALVVTAAAALLSAGAIAFFLAMQRRLFRALRVSEIVLIALFATMTFALAVFPGSVLGPLFSAIAGPFQFLLQGVFFEGVRVLVLVTLVVLVPKPGTVALVSLVRYLLGGLAFGGFTPVDLVYLGSSVTLTEAALYFGGLTGKRGLLRSREVGLGGVLYLALLVGVANAAVQYVTYCLNISLYRLYFADWFIALAVGVNGFLYAVLGALPGVKLGQRLRRISE